MAPGVGSREVKLFPRWSAYGLVNGTSPTLTERIPQNGAQAVTQTPSAIPAPSYVPVSVSPADKIAQTTHAPVPTYSGSGNILNGYCEVPAYTILDGPTALWVPVVGCISSKSDCCATATAGSNVATTGGGGGGGGGTGNEKDASFPISLFPSQGTITGCPKDYHTVGGSACCPSSYWLWSTAFGGQIPCYSSMNGRMDPPPMPDTLAHITTGAPSTSSSGHPTTAKPTSAIVNIVYAMPYPMVAPPQKPALEKAAKIGLGVGVPSAAIIIGVLLWFLVRRFRSRRARNKAAPIPRASVGQRFGEGIDTRYIAHHATPFPHPSEMMRTEGGAKYVGVPTRQTDAHF